MNGSYQQVTLDHGGTSWRGRYSYLDPATGNRVHRRVHAPTKKACQAKVRDALAKIEAGETPKDDKLTVAVFLDRWLGTVEGTVRPSTYRRYRDLLTKHAYPQIGNTRLVKLTALDLQALYADRVAAGLSPTTVRQIHAVLHRALRQAHQWGLADRNVASLATAPRRAKPMLTTWSATEAATVLAHAAGTDLDALWHVALLCGLRRGELLGLRWEDVDLIRGSIAIRHTMSRGKDASWHLGEPKTGKGRAIAVSTALVATLVAHRDRQAFQRQRLNDAWIETGFVFTNRTGGPLHVNRLAQAFRQLIAETGVPKLRLHDLRHSCATLLLGAGVPVHVVARRLGHAKPSMTLDVYAHSIAGDDAGAAERLAVLLGDGGAASPSTPEAARAPLAEGS
ncbi:MAG: site-specific integrase [Chloroflexota bacterium]|nr:site-specific integrase [Chloroflexota bacterium]